MCQRDHSRPGADPASRQSRQGYGVMRALKWSCLYQPFPLFHQSCHADNGGHLQTLLQCQRGQNARNASGDHGFSRPGRSHHQKVMESCRRNLRSTPGCVLAVYLFKIRYVLPLLCRRSPDIPHPAGQQFLFFLLPLCEKGKYLSDIFGSPHPNPRNHGSLPYVCGRNNALPNPSGRRLPHNGQHTPNPFELAVQPQLPQKKDFLCRRLSEAIQGIQDSHCYGKVKGTSLFSSVRRRKIYRHLLRRQIKSRIFQRNAHPLPGLLYLAAQGSHHRKTGQTGSHIHLHKHQIGRHSLQGSRNNSTIH